ISFNELVENFDKFREIDFLQIDTEGFDGEIIKSIDFKGFFSSVIKYESCNLESKEKLNAKEYLLKKGYMVFDELYNSISVYRTKKVFFK
ncbi:FkbM family methyltransferase, partial [Belliella pelovolcani]|uniref:FkbM family methyltransferase n=1 Tax=Belliella pelovolcani TaxID=529505 RepID=UPI00391B3869